MTQSVYGEVRDGRSEIPGHAAVGSVAGTDAVDTLYERAQKAGAELEYELRDTDYGSHEFAARDAEGNVWSVGTYRPKV